MAAIEYVKYAIVAYWKVMDDVMKINETLKALALKILSEKNEHLVMSRLQQQMLESVVQFNRFNAKHERQDSLRNAIEALDDVRALLKIVVELKCIEYDAFKEYEDQSHQLVKMMVSEMNMFKRGEKKFFL